MAAIWWGRCRNLVPQSPAHARPLEESSPAGDGDQQQTVFMHMEALWHYLL